MTKAGEEMIEFRKNWSDEKLDIVMNDWNEERLDDEKYYFKKYPKLLRKKQNVINTLLTPTRHTKRRQLGIRIALRVMGDFINLHPRKR